MAKPIVAIVGRPNVGKSTLFNKLIGQRLSIVEDTPGVTRDRVYAPCSWNGRTFMLVDTGGIELSTDSHIMQQMRAQAEMAIETADLVVLMTDVETGVTAADQDVADMLLKAKKKILLAVNKVDGTGDTPPDVYEFYNLGLGDPYPISSVHGLGTGDLLDRIVEMLPPEQEGQEEDEAVRVAVIGKPNAGKSSLVNCILGQQRVIVSSEAGTTRDAVDTPFENENGKYIFIDTAGLRRRRSVEEDIEKYSVIRANMAIERADVCLILIDGTEGVTEQDTKVAGLAHESGKACVIVVNKWDAVEKDERTMDEMRKDVARKFSFMSYAPIAFISAKTGQRVNRLFELINYVHEQNCMRISTGRLNEVLADALLKVQPPTDKGKRLKILYMTQVSVKPPTFVIFCNRAEIFHFSYQRYLENQIRSVFGLEGTCIRFIIREKGERN
ncbi:MAG TPA: ribosome biogenesis GTPase Der [Candidatus Galloscillospira excrementipullorum]|nr:ribosome biogenesis GTPase Der [Candidatus Galloscillospira excrementipullorum]